MKSSTVPSYACPETYLQLLSLHTNPDGFWILQNLIYLRSPQLKRKFKDYRSLVEAITIIPGEHIREFYSRVVTLSQEIASAKIPDGSIVFFTFTP